MHLHVAETTFKEQPSLSLILLHWTCKEDCSYICTWKTVDSFVSHGLKIPQFHGKVSKMWKCKTLHNFIRIVLKCYMQNYKILHRKLWNIT